MADERHDTAFVVGAILGGLTGAAVTLFNVPQSGARTRAQIAAQAQTLARGLTGPARRLSDGLQGRVVETLTQRSQHDDAGEADAVAAAPDMRTGPLAPVGSESDAMALVEAPLSSGDEIDIVIDGPRPADPPSQG